MSYILDALRRAQAERDRGQVPGLHAQPAPAALALPSRRGMAMVLWLCVGLLLGLAGALAALWLRPDTALPTPTSAAAPTLASAQGNVAPPLSLIPAGDGRREAAALGPSQTPALPPVRLPAARPVALSTSAPPVGARVSAGIAAGAADGAGAAATAVASATPPRAISAPRVEPGMPFAQAVPNAPAPAAAAPPAPAASAEPRAVPLAQLAPELRRELPALAVSGSIWSESAVSRYLIVNGQVVREGESVAAGVTLEHIGPKSAVLRWRGMRIELPF